MSAAKKAPKVPSDAELAGTADKKPDPPVYDERGNVRPRGTKGARPMTYAERVKIAKQIQDEAEGKPAKRARRTARKAAAAKKATATAPKK